MEKNKKVIMNILFDIGHPAHVYKFINLIKILENSKHNVVVVTKNVKSIVYLLKKFDISYINIGEKSDSLFGKFYKQIIYSIRLLRIIKKNKVNLIVGSISAAHVSKLSNAKSIMFDDDDDAVEPLIVKFAHPFCNSLLSPDCLKGSRKKSDTIYYSGYHELAYLHPNIFTPNKKVLEEIGLKKDEIFFILRFNVFKAHHDIGINGLSLQQKLELVKLLEKHGRIFITTERNIEPELRKYQLPISSEKMHSLMAFSTMFLGDSQTMTSEAAVLGIPSVRCNDFVGRISYLEEEEHKYGLTFGFKPSDFSALISKVKELLSMKNLREEFQKRRKKMLNEKIDVSAFMVWFVENYPDSVKIMKENPDYQYRFK